MPTRRGAIEQLKCPVSLAAPLSCVQDGIGKHHMNSENDMTTEEKEARRRLLMLAS
jgi:hypothetical protein